MMSALSSHSTMTQELIGLYHQNVAVIIVCCLTDTPII